MEILIEEATAKCDLVLASATFYVLCIITRCAIYQAM
jgi:hypothetical protein